MPRTKKTPAADQYAALGITEDQWTQAMKTAVTQKWAGLPVTTKVSELVNDIAGVTMRDVPSVNEILADSVMSGATFSTREAAEKEHKRLTANARVTAWRTRAQLQAALDARRLVYANLAAKKHASVGAVRSESGDAAPTAVAS